jgi:WD40 repeat protein
MRSDMRSYKFLIGVAVALAVVLWAIPERSAAQQNAMGHPVEIRGPTFGRCVITGRFGSPAGIGDGLAGLGGLSGIGGGLAGLAGLSGIGGGLGGMLVPGMPTTPLAAPPVNPLISLFGGAGGLGGIGSLAGFGGGLGGFGQQVEPWATLKGHKEAITSLAFYSDGRTLASSSTDGTVRLWEVATGKERTLLKGHKGGVVAVVFAPDGKLLVSGGFDGVMRLWDAAGRACGTLKGPDKSTLRLCLSPDGTTLAVGGGTSVEAGDLRLWDVRAGKVRFPLRGHNGFVSSLSFSADGRMLAGGDVRGIVTIWEVASGKVRTSLKGGGCFVRSLTFLPGDYLLASDEPSPFQGDGTIRLWDVRAGKQRLALKGHADPVFCVTATNALFASVGWDRTVRLWDRASGKGRVIFKGENWVLSVAFSPGGKLLAVGDGVGTIRLWSVAKLLAHKGKK